MTPRLLTAVLCLAVGASVGGDVTPDGKPAQIVLAMEERLHNTGGSDGPKGPGSGSGLCVFTSVEHSGRYQGVETLRGFQKWMTNHPGGGDPQKLDKMLAAYYKEKGLPVPKYVQNTSGDLDLLIRACQTRRMPCITYCMSPSGRYGGGRIAHMVNLTNAGAWWGILDNNYEKEIEWLTTEEFKRTFQRDGWAVILLDHGPPPPLKLPR